MSKEDKFNPERLLRSLGFTSVSKDEDGNSKPSDWGSSRFYNHPLGYRVDITYDDNTTRKPDNVLYYMFRDNQHREVVEDYNKSYGQHRTSTEFANALHDFNKELKEFYKDKLEANPLLKKYVTTFEYVGCSGFHPSHFGTRTKGHLSMDWWLETFKNLEWDVDMMKEAKEKSE